MKRILVLGASGGCGAHVVRHAVARGYAVTAIVRTSTRYEAPAGATVIRGDVLGDGVIAGAIRGHDVAISCVGIRRKHPRFPWSKLISPPDLVARTTERLIEAAVAAHVPRVLLISAAGVGDSAPRMNWVMRFLVKRSNIGAAYRDLGVAERLLAASPLDWTAVRPVTLSNGRARGVKEVDRFGTIAMIPREAVALWLLDHLDVAATRTPMIARG